MPRFNTLPLFLLAVGILAPAAEGAAAAKPNVLLIIADDLGYADLSCYGGQNIQTPNIDALAARGVRGTQFYANCPVCSPTRAALLTGRFPDLVGVPGVVRPIRDINWGHLDPQAVLLPEHLKTAGYDTALVGKWHLGVTPPNLPNRRGFDYFHGWLSGMMQDYYEHLQHDTNFLRRNQTEIEAEGHATDLFTEWAVAYLEERAEEDRPFFLQLAYTAPHTPIQPPQDWFAKVQAREPEMAEDRAKLVALIEHMDHGIGRVMNALEATGLQENTLVIFVSDNGGRRDKGSDNGPWRGGKQDLYEGGIRVPLIAAWPGQLPAGAAYDGIGITMDLFPTIAAVAGAKTKGTIEGVNLLPKLKGESRSRKADQRTFFWVRREGHRYGGRAYYAARRGVFKLVQNTPFEPYELYNLADDPEETNPLSGKHPQYKELFDALRDHINQAGRIPWQRDE